MTPSPATFGKAARPARVAFRSFGCKLNLYESSGMSQAARRAGFTVVETGDPGADVIVVNTCSVTMRADQEARQYLRAAHRRNPGARLVVTGCYAQRAPEELASLPGVALVAGHAEKDRLAEFIGRLPEPGGSARVEVAPIESKGMPALRAVGVEGRTRALLRVQDGCDCACTYCIIPRTRGASHSLDFEETVGEARRMLEAGFRELVLTGTHLGHYGLDLRPRRRLSDLLAAIVFLDAPHAFRVRLSSVEPQEIDERTVELLAAGGRVAPHLHLPLQSGSDTLLRAMRRSYRIGNYRKQVLKVAERVPDLGLGADLIVGFPGETEEDFRSTLALLADLPFTYLHPFTYSPRPGTPAAGWAGRPPGDVARRRLEQARAVIAHGNRRFRESQIGRPLRVLVEATDARGVSEGVSGNYLRVRFRGPRDFTGRFALVTPTGLTDHGLEGTLLEGLV